MQSVVLSRSSNVCSSASVRGVSLFPSSLSEALSRSAHPRKVRLALWHFSAAACSCASAKSNAACTLTPKSAFNCMNSFFRERITHLGYGRRVVGNPFLEFYKNRGEGAGVVESPDSPPLSFSLIVFISFYYSLSRRCPAVVPKSVPTLSRFCPISSSVGL